MADQIKNQMGKTRNSYKIVIGRSERKSIIGRTRCNWDIKTNLKQQIYDRLWTGFIWLRTEISGGIL
jgi:hypothetical protein